MIIWKILVWTVVILFTFSCLACFIPFFFFFLLFLSIMRIEWQIFGSWKPVMAMAAVFVCRMDSWRSMSLVLEGNWVTAKRKKSWSVYQKKNDLLIFHSSSCKTWCLRGASRARNTKAVSAFGWFTQQDLLNGRLEQSVLAWCINIYSNHQALVSPENTKEFL